MRNAAVLFVALALALTLAEVALRFTHPLWVIPYPPACFWPDRYERWDPYGYRLRPSRHMAEDYPPAAPRHLAIDSNAEGFRSARDIHEPDPRPRILVLGDSMVFGSGVEASERFTELLEASEPGWRVDNLGMVGYGADLMLRALETVGVDVAPDVVVFAVFSPDVYRVMPEATGVGFPLPRYTLVDGRLATLPYPDRPAWKRLRLVQGLRYVYWRYSGASLGINAAILARVRALAVQHHFTPAILYLPTRRDRWDDRRRSRWLAAWAAQHAVPFLDLSPAVAAGGGESLYLPEDGHWNPRGHRVAADALHPFLAGLLAERFPRAVASAMRPRCEATSPR